MRIIITTRGSGTGGPRSEIFAHMAAFFNDLCPPALFHTLWGVNASWPPQGFVKDDVWVPSHQGQDDHHPNCHTCKCDSIGPGWCGLGITTMPNAFGLTHTLGGHQQ